MAGHSDWVCCVAHLLLVGSVGITGAMSGMVRPQPRRVAATSAETLHPACNCATGTQPTNVSRHPPRHIDESVVTAAKEPPGVGSSPAARMSRNLSALYPMRYDALASRQRCQGESTVPGRAERVAPIDSIASQRDEGASRQRVTNCSLLRCSCERPEHGGVFVNLHRQALAGGRNV